MAVQIQLRRDTAANWTSNNPTLASGEVGVETDTNKIKIGDGSTAWTSLDYFAPGGSYAQEVVVAKSGGDYTTITAALNSITDASTSKRYVVKVMPGDYAENVVAKSWVDIEGENATTCRITPTSGTALNLGSTFCNVFNIGVYQNLGTATADTTGVIVTGGARTVQDCVFEFTKSGGDYSYVGSAFTGGVTFYTNVKTDFTITGGTGNTKICLATSISGTGTVFVIKSGYIDCTNSDTNDILAGAGIDGATGFTFEVYETIYSVDNNGAGITAGLYTLNTSTGSIKIVNTDWEIASNSGDCYGGFLSNTDTVTAETFYNRMKITSTSANAYAGFIGTNANWKSHYDDVSASNGINGTGSIMYHSAFFPGHIAMSDYIFQGRDGVGGTDCNTANPGNAIPLNTEDIKDDMYTHSTSTNNSRITCTRPGIYKVSYGISHENQTTGRKNVKATLRKNGSTTLSEGVSYAYSRDTTDEFATNTATAFITLAANDYLEVVCYGEGSTGSANTVAGESYINLEFIR